MSNKINQEIDDIMEDLIIGHNFDYAGKAIKKLVRREKRKSLTDRTKEPYEWSWEDLEALVAVFDRVEVNFFDGGEHKPFSGDSGVSVLRVRSVEPTKTHDKKVYLHVSTDANWFAKGRNRILSDDYIEKLVRDTVAELDFSGQTPHLDAEKAILKAFRIGEPPLGEPFIRSSDEG